MSTATGRYTAANVQAVADNITPHAIALGLMKERQALYIDQGVKSAGVPWVAVVMEVGSDGLRRPAHKRRPEFLPNTLGTSAREAHSALTAALVALREAVHVQKERARWREAEGAPDYASIIADSWLEAKYSEAHKLARRLGPANRASLRAALTTAASHGISAGQDAGVRARLSLEEWEAAR